ncbi:MAG: DNA-3-methyladenine glycosylase I [Lachnospiraceae bacterium]|jgi:DNA-3-methyladenine glycosylase I|nr:DNA-3-methyladenine glycosylase I [Lachnospiraceae bacterium]
MNKRRCDFEYWEKEAARCDKVMPYHDNRWCKPEHRDQELFAMLVLEGMQAGVSWTLILKKEEAFRKDFDGFDPVKVAAYDQEKVRELLTDPGIIRNFRKIESAITNAQAFLKVQQEWGSFDSYIWHFTDGKVIDHRIKRAEDVPAEDELSRAVSKDLKKRGFKFVGPVIIYSYLQGIGVVNDHSVYCDYR